MLRKGNPQGFMGCIPTGGHTPPIQIEGDNALWKKVQKKEKKNITSEAINNFIPSFIPFLTCIVWLFLDSVMISANHLYKLKINKMNGNTLKPNGSYCKFFKCAMKTKTIPRTAHDTQNGQGLLSTK